MLPTVFNLLLLPLTIAEVPPVFDRAAVPTVDEILQKWAAATQFDVLRVQFRRYIYDFPFRIEKRSTGTFAIDGPNLGRLVVDPAEVTEKEQLISGFTYQIRADEADRWEWLATKVVQRDTDGNVTFEMSTTDQRVAKSFLGRFIQKPQSTLPFLADIRVDDITKHFTWRFVKQNANGYWLEATPRTPDAKRICERYQVIVEPATFRTFATEYTDASGNMRVVYVFRDYRVGTAPAEAPKPR